jgi:hypothetical protein
MSDIVFSLSDQQYSISKLYRAIKFEALLSCVTVGRAHCETNRWPMGPERFCNGDYVPYDAPWVVVDDKRLKSRRPLEEGGLCPAEGVVWLI